MFPSDYFPPDFFSEDYFAMADAEVEEVVIAAGGSGGIPTFSMRFPDQKATSWISQYWDGDNINRLSVLPNTDEGLTGMVSGIKASDLEERFARACDKMGVPYRFQVSYLAPHNMPGEYKLDFLVEIDGQLQPVAIDGEYAHKSSVQRRKDEYKDVIFNNAKRSQFQPVKRITYDRLETQEMANDTVKEELLWWR